MTLQAIKKFRKIGYLDMADILLSCLGNFCSDVIDFAYMNEVLL